MANLPTNVKDLKEQALQTAERVGAEVKDKAHEAAGAATDAAKNLGRKADDAVGAAGGGLRTAADSLRQHTPHEGVLGAASSRVADALDRGGRYLEEEKLSGLAKDMAALVRRYPLPAVLLGVGLGFLIARTGRR
jgi:hypothetical protein